MRLLVLMLFAVLSACSSKQAVIKLYDGADKAPEQLVTVIMPVEMEVVMINGKEVDARARVLTYGDRQLMFSPGKYEIAAYYKDVWELNADEHEVIKSNPSKFVIDGAAGSVFRIGFDQPENVEAARTMAASFTGYVENTVTGERIVGEESGLVLNKGFVSLVSGAPAVVPETQTSVAPLPKAASVQPAQQPADEPVTEAVVEPVAENSAVALDQLKANWKAASKEQRAQFLQWITQ